MFGIISGYQIQDEVLFNNGDKLTIKGYLNIKFKKSYRIWNKLCENIHSH